MSGARVGIRWTVGDVSPFGFEALQCSIWGARRVFGERAAYLVCVNSVPLDVARERTGEVPGGVEWRAVGEGDIPAFVAAHLDRGKAEGVGWKFAHLHAFPERFELALDNDCILWACPPAVARWLEAGAGCVIAEDVRACFGRFAELCGDAPRNSGIRGLPPGFDLEGAIAALLRERPGALASELDEQGMQVALVERAGAPFVVRLESVSICSPFPPHLPHLGRCGAHFVGVNARRFPWEHEGRNGADWVHEHWLRHRDAVRARVGLSAGSRVRECAEGTGLAAGL